ncbi:MAG: TIGR03668 family PPOX class F420-dependent oxidoreductase [Candidatus Rokubacteria bacterium]|nr:TIGR03668 family PPOX class F420-dependent oxidoreductase [Candidatus Rokubacteria bacterium]
MMSQLAPGVQAFLEAGRVARLGTADSGGQPLVVPVCYAFDGRHCYSAIDAKPKRAPAAELKRVRNIRENPRVCLVVDHYDEDWSRLCYVILQGRAELLTEGPEFSQAVGLLLAKYPQYRAVRLDRTSGLVIKITPERVVEWSSAAPSEGGCAPLPNLPQDVARAKPALETTGVGA